MIEAGASLLRLLLGMGALILAGLGILAGLTPASPSLPWRERAPFAFGLGTLALTLWMLALSGLGGKFNLPLILTPPLALAAAGWLVRWKFGGGGKGSQALSPSPKSPPPLTGLEWIFWGLLGLLFLFATLRAGLYPMWSWDALATWGCKARVFYLDRSLDLSCIESHNYYPNLVPLLLTYLYLCLGEVNDHLVKLVFPLWGALLLTLLYSFLLRTGLSRRQALGTTTFFALSGSVFIVHLYIAYADLPLAFFTLGAAGLLYLWLKEAGPPGSLPLLAFCIAAMAWTKFEGPPLAATLLLAAALTLLCLRPPEWGRRLLQLAWPGGGLLLGILPWRLFMAAHHIPVGSDHLLNFYPQQFLQAIPHLLFMLINPRAFGILWPALLLALVLSGRQLWTTPRLFLALFLGGNLLAILLAYSLTPTSAAEFLQHVRATLDRLLLHITPVAALLLGEGVKELGEGGQGPEVPSPQAPHSTRVRVKKGAGRPGSDSLACRPQNLRDWGWGRGQGPTGP
jgi:hypothetical protein